MLFLKATRRRPYIDKRKMSNKQEDRDMIKCQQMLKEKDGLNIAKYFKTHLSEDGIPSGSFNHSWFERSIAEKWTLKANFQEMKSAMDALVETLKEEDNEWLSPLVGIFAQRLRILAGHDHRNLQITKELFDSIFRLTLAYERKARQVKQSQNHNSEAPLQSDLPLLLVTELMKIYALLGSDSMTKSLIGSVEHPTFPPLDSFSVTRRIIYSYYAGRSAVLEGEPEFALPYLTFAYNAIGKNHHEPNRKRILEYLLPVKVALGFQPKRAKFTELEKEMPQMALAIRAIANGDSRKLVQILYDNQSYFCRRGTYSLLAKCRMIAARNLLRHCIQFHRDTVDATEKNKFPLSKFYPAVQKWDDYDISDSLVDHSRCLVVNLIAQGLIKGYLSYEREILVVSANDAFPKTSAVFRST
jgi:hypothetical protein